MSKKKATPNTMTFTDGGIPTDSFDQTSWSGTSWMDDLKEKIENQTLNRVAIPGTHDSATYGITKDSADSPDNDPSVTTIKSWMGPKGIILLTPIVGAVAAAAIVLYLKSKVNSVIAGWAKAQGNTIAQQLAAGVRYIDLRVAQKSDGVFYTVHGKYSVNIDDVLNDVKTFVGTHPNEIIFLDFNHLYLIPSTDDGLIVKIKQAIGDKMAPRGMTPHAQVSDFWNAAKNIIVFYDDKDAIEDEGTFWLQSQIDSPWPNKQDDTALKTALAGELPNTRNSFFVLQGLRTPNNDTIADGLKPLSSSPDNLQELANTTTPAVSGWVSSDWKDKGLNIVIADWVNAHTEIITSVINLNQAGVPRNMYSVTIETAHYDEMPHPRRALPHDLEVSGKVHSTNKNAPATGVTIVLNLINGDKITMVTNHPVTAPIMLGAPATFLWSGPIPGHTTIAQGSCVTVFSNRQSNATKEVFITE